MRSLDRRNKGAELWRRAKRVIPGGNQLLSKRAEMFLPEYWPAYYSKARGIDVWALDGNRYADFGIMGIGTCPLGYSHPDVNRAVKRAVDNGNMSTLNCPEEVELAEKLVGLHRWAGMVRFARTGGEACAVAIRIARAHTGRDTVLFCGYHGWSDWYLSANLTDAKNLDAQLLNGLQAKGVPGGLRGSALPFHYGDLKEFKERLRQAGEKPAAVIMEFARHHAPDIGFLKQVRRLASKAGAVLIFDEITTGFRQRAGGMHVKYGIEPDIVVLGKAMGNGHPIAAVVGRTEVMQAAQGTFISSTYWTERTGYAAALQVIKLFRKKNVPLKIRQAGTAIRNGLDRIFLKHGLKIEVEGLAEMPILAIREEDPALLKTVYVQEMLKRGFLVSTVIYPTTAHTPGAIRRFLRSADDVFARIAFMLRKGKLKEMLNGPVCHTGFKRLA